MITLSLSQLAFRNAFDCSRGLFVSGIDHFCCFLANEAYPGVTINNIRLECQKLSVSMKDTVQESVRRRRDKRVNWDVFVIGTLCTVRIAYKQLHDAQSGTDNCIPCPNCTIMVRVWRRSYAKVEGVSTGKEYEKNPAFLISNKGIELNVIYVP